MGETRSFAPLTRARSLGRRHRLTAFGLLAAGPAISVCAGVLWAWLGVREAAMFYVAMVLAVGLVLLNVADRMAPSPRRVEPGVAGTAPQATQATRPAEN